MVRRLGSPADFAYRSGLIAPLSCTNLHYKNVVKIVRWTFVRVQMISAVMSSFTTVLVQAVTPWNQQVVLAAHLLQDLQETP